jgi:hypothetical protein
MALGLVLAAAHIPLFVWMISEIRHSNRPLKLKDLQRNKR